MNLSKAPTRIITQARRLRALMPSLTPDRVSKIVDDVESTIPLVLGPETIAAARERLGTGRSAIPLNSRVYGTVTGEVAAYRNGYADGFVDSVTLRSARPPS